MKVLQLTYVQILAHPDKHMLKKTQKKTYNMIMSIWLYGLIGQEWSAYNKIGLK